MLAPECGWGVEVGPGERTSRTRTTRSTPEVARVSGRYLFQSCVSNSALPGIWICKAGVAGTIGAIGGLGWLGEEEWGGGGGIAGCDGWGSRKSNILRKLSLPTQETRLVLCGENAAL